MSNNTRYDAIIVGAGPNGLAAAITLAQTGRRVLVVEARDTVGGGASSAEVTLPGFTHDLGSAIHPLGAGSPFFRTLPLAQFGLRWIHPDAPLAHPLDDGTAVMLERSVGATAANLGPDAAAYRRLMTPIVRQWDKIVPTFLGPLRFPKYPVPVVRFGIRAIWATTLLANTLFHGERARALLAGSGAHSFLPLEKAPSAAFGLVLNAAGHAVGWPFPQGGAQALSDALAAYLRSLGGEIKTGWRVDALDELPAARAVLCDVTPRQLLRIAGDALPQGYRRALSTYRYNPGAFKIDWALSEPIPWTAAACRRAGTVHVGGTIDEIAAAERAPHLGEHFGRPFVLLAQQSLFDPSRAPEGRHTAWGYCHVPNGSTDDMTGQIEAQIERFAPGFRERIIGRSTMNTIALETYNANLVGGDVNGGVQDFGQLFTRPTLNLRPYRTAARGIYICSSSTPPGGGVHGMCGYHAAQMALRNGV